MAGQQFIESPTYREFVTQFESAPKVLDPAFAPIRRKDINTEGNGFKPNQRYTSHTPDGHDTAVGTALVYEDATYGGNAMPRYSELLQDIPLICGPTGFVSQTTLANPDGRVKTVYQLPHTPRTIREITAWFGYGNKVWLLQQGAIRSWSIETSSTGETGGNKEFHFIKCTPGQVQPAAVAQSAILRFDGANVSGPGVFSVKVGSNAAQNVSLAIGDTTSQTATKFAAVGLTVTVVGTVAAATTADLTQTSGGTASTSQTNAGNAFDTSDATVVNFAEGGGGVADSHWLQWDFGVGNAKTVTSATLKESSAQGWNLQGSNDGSNWTQLSTLPGVGGAAERNFTIATPANYRFYRIGMHAASAATTVLRLQLLALVPAGGSIVATVTSPTNTPVLITKVSGDGWTGILQQAGQDGNGPLELPGGFVEPTHWVVYKAATWAELQNIDMGSKTVPAPLDESHLVKTAVAHSITIDNLVGTSDSENRSVNADGHVATAPAVTSSLTLKVLQNPDGTDYVEDIFATDNRGGCGTTPFWLRFAARCGDRELWIDIWVARNEAANPTTQEGEGQWEFPLVRIYRRAGSLFFTIIEPAS